MTLYLGAAHGRPSALLRELVRQWWGRTPGWTVALTGFGSPATALVLGGLVERIITTFIGEGYPYPTPQPLVGRAVVLDGTVAVQNWSMLTLPLRLIAGALGVPFLPTRSLLGSSMEEDNARAADFLVLDDPFYSEGATHGRASGATAPSDASPRTDRVPTEFIRRHSSLVRLPGQYVSAVVEAPLGAHPGAMYGLGIPELVGYAEDLEFILELRRAFRRRETATAWIKEWMLDVSDQPSYVAKIGQARVREVSDRAQPEAWKAELAQLANDLPAGDTATPSEMMVVAAARVLAEKVRAHGYRTFLAGVGNSNLAAWLAAYELKAAGVDVDLMAETGMVGYLPRPAEPFVFSFRNFPSSKMLTDIFHVMGIFMGGGEARCLGSLAAGQIDKHGNINSTIVPGATYITGSGGANDIASAAREVLVTLAQSRTRFVEKVPYITAPGQRVMTVVSDLGVFAKPDARSELVLSGVFAGRPEAESVLAAREACGWDLKVAPSLQRLEAPSADELRLTRLFDPRRYFLGGV